MKFKFMAEHKDTFSTEAMCRVFCVSRSGFYAFMTRPESDRARENKKLLGLIKQSVKNSRQTYGYRRVHADLTSSGEKCGENKILWIMRANDIRPKTRKKFRVTTNSKHQHPIHENHLNREFAASAPNERWTSDITYIPTQEGWLYLAVVMDLYSRKIIGWAMSSHMKESLVLDALRMALFKRKIKSGLLLHSDRGVQYASHSYQALLKHNNIKCSMSRKGNCWDNAAMESFFHTLKTECVHHEKYETRDKSKKSVFDYIEVFYNRKRKHSYLGYMTPEQYEMVA